MGTRRSIRGEMVEVEDRWVEIGDPASFPDFPIVHVLAYSERYGGGLGWPMKAADMSEMPGCGSLWGMPIKQPPPGQGGPKEATDG